MARTGIKISVSNTVFGAPINVDSNTLLIVAGAAATTGGDIAFSLGIPYLLRGFADLDALNITEDNNPEIYKEVRDFYRPTDAIDNTGTVLWLVGVVTFTDATTIFTYVRDTVVSGFEYRPRNILISQINAFAARQVDPSDIQTTIDAMYEEGFCTVAILGDCLRGAAKTYDAPDLSEENAPMVGVLVCSDVKDGRAAVGKVGGLMSAITVGTSIGDTSFPPLATDMYFVDLSGVSTYVNTHCSGLSLAKVNEYGDKQYIFARNRAPLNGFWLNDGATCVDSTTALSTLEGSRTLASIVDALRTFFTPMLNTRVPVTADGDIAPTVKSAIVSSAKLKVIDPYIEVGDISDARIDLRAKDDDMVGTRTWEVSLSVLPAPTLRWVDGYVFYVKSF